MKREAPATIIVIVGITGDLSRRKLLPAIEQIASAQVAPKKFKIIGVTRQQVSAKDVLTQVSGQTPLLQKYLEIFTMDITRTEEYKRLHTYLQTIEKGWGGHTQRLYYLSVPLQISEPIIETLGKAGLARNNAKLLIEKPFGVDFTSAQELVERATQHFAESQIYRIDHYLAKETVQNFITFRADNSLFKRTWHKDFIDRIEIIASEKIGIEGRAAFYEQTGALRDVVQSHLLQLAALALMHTPKNQQLTDVPNLRLEALRQMRLPADKDVDIIAKRAQYLGYRDEVNNSGSSVETYVDLALTSADPRWQGVPIRLVTGKALNSKSTSIRIVYKKEEDHEANELIIRLQPNEGVELKLWTKVPGYEWKVETHKLGFSYKDHFPKLPEAYERVFLDAINSNHTLFTSSEEVLETWRILEPLQKAWSMSMDKIVQYARGSDINLQA